MSTPKVVLGKGQISTEPGTGNLVNFCSWTRLVEELRESGTVKPNEEVVCFELTPEGIMIRMRYI